MEIKIIYHFLGCLKHDRSLCHECKEDGMCDGQPADNCTFMKLNEFESALNDRLTRLNEQFVAITDVLKAKKDCFIQMYRKDPRISHDEAVSCLHKINESFESINPSGGQGQDTIKEQLNQLQEQLVQQQELAAEAELMRKELADQKNQIEDMYTHLQQRSTELQVANKNLQACKKNLEDQLEEKDIDLLNLELEKTSLEKKFQQDQIQANDRLKKTNEEKTILERRLNELQSSLLGAERQNEELQLVLDNETREKSNMVKIWKKANSDLQKENEKLAKDVKALTSESKMVERK